MIGSCCQLKTGFQLSDAHLSITGSLLLSLVQIFYFTDNDLDKKRSKHTESTSEWQGHVLPCVSLKFLGHFVGPYSTCVPFLLLNTLFWPSLATLVWPKLARGFFWDNYLIAAWHWPFRPVTWGAKTLRLMATRKKNRSVKERITENKITQI